MIISSRKKFIFFHTPKVAGSSLNAALRKYADIPNSRVYNYMLDYIGPRKALGIFPRHISPLELRDQISSEKYQQYHKIAFVRNPFDWHVSQYHFHKQNSFAVFHQEFQEISFSQYLEWATENQKRSKSNQYRFLSDENDQLLVDFVGKIETINESFESIKKRLGISAVLPHKNKSDRSNSYRQYYSDGDIALVRELNKTDLEFFSYEF